MDNYFPDPLQLMVIKDAVDARRTKLTIDGREFTIRYDKDTFYLAPVEGYVPSGHFSYATAFLEIS